MSWGSCLDSLEGVLNGRFLFRLGAGGPEQAAIQELHVSADALPDAPPDPVLPVRLNRSLKALGAQLTEIELGVRAQLAGRGSLEGCVDVLLETSRITAAGCWMALKCRQADHAAVLALCSGALSLLLNTGGGMLDAEPRRLGPGGREATVPALVSAQLSTLWCVVRLMMMPWNARVRALVGRPSCGGMVSALCCAGSALQRLGPEALRKPAARVFMERFPSVVTMLLDTPDMGFADHLEAADPSCQCQLASHLLCALDWLFANTDADAGAAANAGPGAAPGGDGTSGGSGGGPTAGGSRGLANHTPVQRWHLACQGLSSLASAELIEGLEEEASRGGAVRVLASAGSVLRAAVEERVLVPEELLSDGLFYSLKLAGVASQNAFFGPGAPPAFHGAGRQPSTAGSAQQQAAAWAVLRLLPDMAAGLQRMVRRGVAALGAGEGAWHEEDNPAVEADTACFFATAALDPALAAPRLTDVSQTAIWCQAGTSALQLLPLLSDMHLQFPQASAAAAAQRPDPLAIPALALRCVTVWTAFIKPVSELHGQLTLSPARHADVAAATAEPLWMLHTAALRFVHWAAGQGEQRLAALFPDWDWRWLALNLANTLQLTWEVHRMGRATACIAGNVQQEEALTRRMQAICAAHAAAVAVLGEQMGLRADRLDIGFCLDLRLVAAAAPPPLQTPELLSAFDACVRQDWRASSRADTSLLWERVLKVAIEAEEWPRYAALLLHSGLLAHGVRLAHDAGLHTPSQQAQLLLASLRVLCRNFGIACRRAVEEELARAGGSSSGSSSSSAAGPSAAAIVWMSDAVKAAVDFCEEAGGGIAPPASLALLQLYQHRVLPTAAELATAMQAWWDGLEQRAAAQLEAAQAAGTRSCAYLRCANLGGGGGPAAGQGEGSKRCSGCRSVRYCGTACSHVDWRAGHRRMCTLLAAARREQAG